MQRKRSTPRGEQTRIVSMRVIVSMQERGGGGLRKEAYLVAQGDQRFLAVCNVREKRDEVRHGGIGPPWKRKRCLGVVGVALGGEEEEVRKESEVGYSGENEVTICAVVGK